MLGLSCTCHTRGHSELFVNWMMFGSFLRGNAEAALIPAGAHGEVHCHPGVSCWKMIGIRSTVSSNLMVAVYSYYLWGKSSIPCKNADDVISAYNGRHLKWQHNNEQKSEASQLSTWDGIWGNEYTWHHSMVFAISCKLLRNCWAVSFFFGFFCCCWIQVWGLP